MLFSKTVIGAYRNAMASRQDPIPAVRLFHTADFPNLVEVPYPFQARKGHCLAGRFYFYEGYDERRVIVFDHGMGAGHRAYMKEIERIARAGYRVFAYDHTGCADSEGENTVGFGQSLSDLADCFASLTSDPNLKGVTFSAIGHSWGAYAVMNIGALVTGITHIVALSGFVSVEAMLKQNFSGLLRPYFREIYRIEQENNPKTVSLHAADSLRASGAKVLLIHSPDDPLVRAEAHFELLRTALADLASVRFLSVEGRRHNPNYTADAVGYKDAFFADLTKKSKQGAFRNEADALAYAKSWDFERMTEQDEAVWTEILDHLSS